MRVYPAMDCEALYRDHRIPVDVCAAFEALASARLSLLITNENWVGDTLVVYLGWGEVEDPTDPLLHARLLACLAEAADEEGCPPVPVSQVEIADYDTAYTGENCRAWHLLPDDLWDAFSAACPYLVREHRLDGDELLLTIDCDEYAAMQVFGDRTGDGRFDEQKSEILNCLRKSAASLGYPPPPVAKVVLYDDGCTWLYESYYP